MFRRSPDGGRGDFRYAGAGTAVRAQDSFPDRGGAGGISLVPNLQAYFPMRSARNSLPWNFRWGTLWSRRRSKRGIWPIRCPVQLRTALCQLSQKCRREDPGAERTGVGCAEYISRPQVERGLPDEYFVNSKEAAFTRMAARFRENTPEAAALRQLLPEILNTRAGWRLCARAAAGRPARLEDSALAAGLFSSAPYLSATQIETYYDCKFKYFCRYGINAKERRPAEVDVMQYGTLMHYLFEGVLRAG